MNIYGYFINISGYPLILQTQLDGQINPLEERNGNYLIYTLDSRE